MFKRANKMTALLVAAASVMAMVPAMAADSTGSRLGTKDGTIDNALAYKDGKYVYQGYRSDEDERAIYFNNGEKDSKVEDVEDADLGATGFTTDFDGKYATAVDGNDYYEIDLTTGKSDSDNTADDQIENAETKLKNQLKKTKRYGDTFGDKGAVTLDQITQGPKFGDTWYSYDATNPEKDGNALSDAKGVKHLYGFANETGAKYIDASNLANIYAYSVAKGKVVKIEEFNDYDSDTKMQVELDKAPEVLTQDKDYIYVLSTVKVTDYGTVSKTDATTAPALGEEGKTKTVTDDNGTGIQTTHYYIQKLSKAQGEDKDDAYLPKTVDSYELLTKKDANQQVDCNDSVNAYDAITEAKNGGKFTIVKGQLLAVKLESDKVTVTSINLKKDKVKIKYTKDTTGDDAKVVAGLDNKDSKIDLYLAEKDDDKDNDIKNEKSVDIDVDGNVWVVNDGKMLKWEKNDFTKEFTLDSSMDRLSVYDEKNIIAWEEDGKIYTTVGEGEKQAKDDANVPADTTPVVTPAPVAKTGWDQLADGTWNLYDATGVKVVNKWMPVNGAWYFLKADGVMATGWFKDADGTWYYLQSSGAMKTGWFQDTDGKWYFLKSSGAMAANETTPDGYYVNASGVWA